MNFRRGVRAGQQVQNRKAFSVLPNDVIEPVIIWPDVPLRLSAYLRGFLFGVERTSKTPQSLMQKSLAWANKFEKHLGEYQHPDRFYTLATDVITQILLPDEREMQVVDVYGNPAAMADIAVVNAAANDMVDIRNTSYWSYALSIIPATAAAVMHVYDVDPITNIGITSCITALVLPFMGAKKFTARKV